MNGKTIRKEDKQIAIFDSNQIYYILFMDEINIIIS